MEETKGTSRRKFLKYLGGITATFGIGALIGSKLTPPVHANAPPSSTVQPDVISTYLHTGPPGTLTWTYNTDGTVATMTYGNLAVTYTYNVDGTIATIVSVDGNVTVTDTYAYDTTGKVSTVTRT